MKILVAYATKHGATEGIAARIGETLVASGHEAKVQSVKVVGNPTGYDAFVIGSAAYMGSWLKEAAEFVRRNQAILAERPAWLFSSGPLGTALTDAQGRDVLVASEPKEFAEFKQTIKPRGMRVFFGALDIGKLGFADRLITKMPAAKALFPEGDFRNWKEIAAWAGSIAHELAPAMASRT
jgi:menaquinone-dependent protoporphyrinogen oxidase